MKYITPNIEVVDCIITETLLVASPLPPVSEGGNKKDDEDLITDPDEIGTKPGGGLSWWGNLWGNWDEIDEG